MRLTLRFIVPLIALSFGLAAEAQAQQLITSVEVVAKPLDLRRVTAEQEVLDLLRQRTSALKTGVCRGEVFQVKVKTAHPAGAGHFVSTTVDGYPGDTKYLQFQGEHGERLVQVSAATEEGLVESRSLTVPVLKCVLESMPRVRARFNPYHPYTVDFVVENPDELTFFSRYEWSFGDGSVGVTTQPFISHSYADRLDGSVPYQTFIASVANQPGPVGGGTIGREYAVTLQNNYYSARQRGIVQPPVTTSGRMETRGGRLVGTYRIRNLEAAPIIFQSARIEDRPCDLARASITSSTTPVQVILQGGFSLERAASTGTAGADVAAALQIKRSLGSLLPADAVVIPPRSKPTDPTPLKLDDLDAYFPNGEPPAPPVGSAPVPTILPAPGASGVVVLPAKHVHDGFLTLDARRISEGICGVGYHLTGVTAAGQPAYVSLYFDVRDNPALKRQVTDAAMKAFVIEILNRGLVPSRSKVTQEDLYRLEQQGLIRRTQLGWEVL